MVCDRGVLPHPGWYLLAVIYACYVMNGDSKCPGSSSAPSSLRGLGWTLLVQYGSQPDELS